MGVNKMNKLYIILAVFALALVGMVAATPAAVTGNIYDQNNANVAGATVDVTCGTDSGSTTSLSDGTYSVILDASKCQYEDAVSVTATLGDQHGSNTGTMCDANECPFPVGLVDVTIPEFGLVGAMIVVLAGVGIIAYRRKN